MSTKIAKLLVVGCVVMALNAVNAQEKVVWNGKDIGKNFLWKKDAGAEVADGVLSMDLKGQNARAVSLSWAKGAEGGVNIKDYKTLVIDLKVEGKIDKTLKFRLVDSKRKKSSPVSPVDFCPEKALPEKMSTVKIPLAEFQNGAKFDTGIIVALFTSVWTKDKTDIKITINKIAFAK